MTRTVKLHVFKGRNNVATLSVVQKAAGSAATPVDWTGVTRMVLVILSATPIVVDTDVVAAGVIDYSTNGQVGLKLGELADVIALTEGEYNCRLTAFDAGGVDTEILHEDHPRSPVILAIWDTSSI